jgi:hypothetical protein
METSQFHVFLSHNSADKPLVEELARRLVKEGLQPWLDKWNLIPGEPWQEAIEEALAKCVTCAVFIGPSGTGPWHNEEMRAAIDRRVNCGQFRVIPVLLPGAERDERSRLPTFLIAATWVEFRHSLDDPEAFHRLVCGIRGVEPGPGPGQASYQGECPYRGLQVFDVQHAPFFFGREALTDWLLNALRSTPGAGLENRFLGIIGASGSGKSSLARAGLVGALRQGQIEGSQHWPILIFRPGVDPLESLAVTLADPMGIGQNPVAINDLIENLSKNERTLHVTSRLALHGTPPERRLALLVDQFEEVFTLCRNEERRMALINNLLYAASIVQGQTIVLLTLRADFYSKCAMYPMLAAALSDHQVLVGPMTDYELRRAIERPAQLVGCEFDAGLVGRLLQDVRGRPGGLPLLQHALLELWQRREGRRLTHTAYDAIGEIEGAIERRAEELYNQFTELQKQVCQRVFLRLTQPGEGVEDTKRRVPLQELMPAVDDQETVEVVIRRLADADARLITTEGGEELKNEQFVEVAHEALIRGWSRLRAWIEKDRAALRTHRRLTEAANEWRNNGEDESFLYLGARLAEAEEWAETYANAMNRLERAFLEASLSLREREAAAKEAQRQRELAAVRKQAETAGRLRKLALLLAGVGLIALTLAVLSFFQSQKANRARLFAEDQKRIAEDQERIAEDQKRIANAARETAERQSQVSQAREMLSLAEVQFNENAECSLALSLKAYNAAQNISGLDLFAFENTLRRALANSHVYKTLAGFSDQVETIAWNADGKTIAATSIGDAVSMWDVETGKKLFELPFNDAASSAAWSPNGQYLAVRLVDGSVKI